MKPLLQDRLVSIVESLAGYDPSNEDPHAAVVVATVPHEGKTWRLEQRFPPTVNAGFAITITGHTWAVLFEDNVLIDSEQDDIGVTVEGADGAIDDDVSLDDAPDDVIRAFLVEQAKCVVASTQRLLTNAAELPAKKA